MSVLNDGNNLPSVLIDFEKETSSDYDTTKWGTTDSVLVIGTAFSGTPGIATRVYNDDMAKYYFGKMYDTKSRKTASLVAGVKDAYDRGCRTIYAMRIGGIDVYKDFKFCEEGSKYRLRVQSLYPSNVAKQCYLKIDTKAGMESISFYKPADKATIVEKKQGVVDQQDQIIETVIDLATQNGIGRDSKLSELIQVFNNHSYNNVLRLSVVDKDGNNASSDPDAQALKVGSLFSGVYFIGRDKNKINAYTSLNTNTVIDSNSDKPYTSYDGKFYRTIQFNSDVTSDYPIHAALYADLREVVIGGSVSSVKDYDFLKVTGAVDKLWPQDDNDYEEVDLSKFEIYKRLGCGYAITAMAVRRMSGTEERVPRIVETPADNGNRIFAIKEGIYATLENAEVDYRVVVAANADDKITAKLPKAEAFKIATPQSVNLFLDDKSVPYATITPTVDESEIYNAKKFKFSVKAVEDNTLQPTVDDLTSGLFSSKIISVIPYIDSAVGTTAAAAALAELKKDKIANVPVGTKLIVGDTLVKFNGKTFDVVNNKGFAGELFAVHKTAGDPTLTVLKGSFGTELKLVAADGSDIGSKTYSLIENSLNVFVAKATATAGKAAGTGEDHTPAVSGSLILTPMGELSAMLSSNDDRTLIYAENDFFNTNVVCVLTSAADFMSLEEFASVLQESETLGKNFKIELSELGYNSKEQYLDDIPVIAQCIGIVTTKGADDNITIKYDGTPTAYSLDKDRIITYDYNKYIPYRTSDNFARQLAQHCARASLRKKTTHGIIGMAPIKNLTLKGVASRVDEALSTDFSLYAKKYNGNMMLDTDGLPFEIGDKISVAMFQSDITTDDAFVYTSNGAASYAGMISALNIEQSSTMQPIALSSIGYNLSSTQMLDLSNKGFVVVGNSERKGLVVIDGVTMSPSDSYRRRLSIVRILNECGTVIRTAAEPYLGMTNNYQNRNAMKTAIESGLASLKGKLIYGYSFTVLNLNSYTSDAYVRISYKIFPINEIREVDNTIKIATSMADLN